MEKSRKSHCQPEMHQSSLLAWDPLGRVSTHLLLCQITFGLAGWGVGLSHYSKWQLVASLWWGRNDDSDSPSPTNSAHSRTCVIINTAETNPHGFCAVAHSTGPYPLQMIRPIFHLSPERWGKLPILTSSSALLPLCVAKHKDLRQGLQGIFLGFRQDHPSTSG